MYINNYIYVTAVCIRNMDQQGMHVRRMNWRVYMQTTILLAQDAIPLVNDGFNDS
jgi:hypothetical protein